MIFVLHKIWYGSPGQWIPPKNRRTTLCLIKTYDQKHLTDTQRIKIEKGLKLLCPQVFAIIKITIIVAEIDLY